MLKHDKPLQGRAVVITGGARRLGRAIALAMAEAGADVAITFRNSARQAQHTVTDVSSFGVRAVALYCDVSDPTNVKSALKEAVKELGGIDVLVNNAANYETAEFEKLSLAQWDAMFASNTRGPFLVYGLARGNTPLGKQRALLRFESRCTHADKGHGQGTRSRGCGQLRGARDDRLRRKIGRSVPKENGTADADAAQRRKQGRHTCGHVLCHSAAFHHRAGSSGGWRIGIVMLCFSLSCPHRAQLAAPWRRG